MRPNLELISWVRHENYLTVKLLHNLFIRGKPLLLPKSLHVRVDERLIHGVGHSPGSLELADEFVVHRTPVVVDQLDLLVGAVVSEAVVDDDVEAV